MNARQAIRKLKLAFVEPDRRKRTQIRRRDAISKERSRFGFRFPLRARISLYRGVYLVSLSTRRDEWSLNSGRRSNSKRRPVRVFGSSRDQDQDKSYVYNRLHKTTPPFTQQELQRLGSLLRRQRPTTRSSLREHEKRASRRISLEISLSGREGSEVDRE